MKALRRSLNSDKSHSSHVSSPSLSSPRPAVVVTAPTTGTTPFTRVAPPQKVIKAVKAYKSDVPLILSYEVGDFFYVAGELEGDERCPEGWYQALSASLFLGSLLVRALTRSACGRPVDRFAGPRAEDGL